MPPATAVRRPRRARRRPRCQRPRRRRLRRWRALPYLPSLIERADRVLRQLEAWLPPAPPPIDWDGRSPFAGARRVHGRDGSGGHLEARAQRPQITLADLQGIDRQKKMVEQNTRQFIAGAPANNVLMTGSRGTGKSSLVKALLHKYAKQGFARRRSRQGRPDRPARHRRHPGRHGPRSSSCSATTCRSTPAKRATRR